MLRLLMLATAALALLAIACGGDDGDSGEADADATQAASGSPTATPTPGLLPTPPRAAEDEVILTASAGQKAYEPTLKEFRGLPRTKVEAKGQKEGVSLNEIAAKVSAAPESFVTVQGFRADGRAIQFVRQPLKDIGAESILIADDNGRLSLVSSKLAESEWLVNVTIVSFP